uniref:Uncharacterized protein n=2 Tax=Oryza sativa subsp. japonica TaxID=39947 RepID=Q7XZY6_ORYSJ|nr:hypothetical protein [Oryza sativa Japonica Group]AAX95543.1 Hypothetical gene [Oryza sativa Japonica Group]ABF97924.1 hypothetical protein LOC_Os03g44850 [Oryza sativa Japonica Group]
MAAGNVGEEEAVVAEATTAVQRGSGDGGRRRGGDRPRWEKVRRGRPFLPLGAAADGGRPGTAWGRSCGRRGGQWCAPLSVGTDDAERRGGRPQARRYPGSKWREDGGDREEEEVVLLLLEPIIVVRQPPAPRATASPACLLYPT